MCEELSALIQSEFADLKDRLFTELGAGQGDEHRDVLIVRAWVYACIKEASSMFHLIEMPDCPAVLSPIVSTVPLQLLAYHAALARGNDVDKPRNLAKSVTVE